MRFLIKNKHLKKYIYLNSLQFGGTFAIVKYFYSLPYCPVHFRGKDCHLYCTTFLCVNDVTRT